MIFICWIVSPLGWFRSPQGASSSLCYNLRLFSIKEKNERGMDVPKIDPVHHVLFLLNNRLILAGSVATMKGEYGDVIFPLKISEQAPTC